MKIIKNIFGGLHIMLDFFILLIIIACVWLGLYIKDSGYIEDI
jgi:hypothetical protein